MGDSVGNFPLPPPSTPLLPPSWALLTLGLRNCQAGSLQLNRILALDSFLEGKEEQKQRNKSRNKERKRKISGSIFFLFSFQGFPRASSWQRRRLTPPPTPVENSLLPPLPGNLPPPLLLENAMKPPQQHLTQTEVDPLLLLLLPLLHPQGEKRERRKGTIIRICVCVCLSLLPKLLKPISFIITQS